MTQSAIEKARPAGPATGDAGTVPPALAKQGDRAAPPAGENAATGRSACRPAVRMDALGRAGLVVAMPRAARTRLSEEFALVQTQILRSLQAAAGEGAQGSSLILVTSARPGEGKSFCALNIAAAIARSGVGPVVLVDVDTKAGSTTALLGLNGMPGIGQIAADPHLGPEALLMPTEVAALSILPNGAAEPGAADAAPAAMVADGLRRLARALPGHLLIVDAPPCLASSEPSALASVAGQVVMVVAAESTQRNELEAALDMVDACPTLQLLLNRVRVRPNDAFGAYGTYDR